MPRQTNKKTREQKLAQARLDKRLKYEEIKNDPEKYAMQKEKERLRYLKRKEQNKLKSVEDMTPREKRQQRKKWRDNSRHFLEKKKKEKIQQLLIVNSPPSSDDDTGENNIVGPLAGPSHHEQNYKGQPNCEQCFKKDEIINRLRYLHKKQIGNLKTSMNKIIKNTLRKMLISILTD